MSENLRIWSKVEKTDPRHTKQVKQRGGFTAIDAHYQVMRATETFGPVGDGWGYYCGAPIFHGDFIIVPVTLWHGDRSNEFGPIYGCAQILGGRPDSDAPKKAMTDALTKGLSHLGFNADVFLGKFDDSKYVADLRSEFSGASQAVDKSAPKQQPSDQDKAVAKQLVDAVKEHGPYVAKDERFSRNLSTLRKNAPALAAHVDAAITNSK